MKKVQFGKYVFDWEIDESMPSDKMVVILKSRKTGKEIGRITNIGEDDIWTTADQNDLEDDEFYRQ